MEVSDAYKGKMDFLVDGNNLYTRTNHNEVYDLVQKFIGLKEQSLDKNEPFDFATAGLIDKAASINSSYSLVLSNGGDEAAPFNFNSSYIGANHGYSKGILVDSKAHGKTYADIGSLWIDASNHKWSLLKVPNENQLLFLSENKSSSLTKFSVYTDIAGDKLTYVSHGKNTGDITIEAEAKNQQIYSANQYAYKKVYAVKGGIRTEAEDGVLTNCDYVDFEEKYYIMNPVMIGATLRENRPEGGYAEPQSMAIGQPLVECVLTYRIMPDSTVLTMFEHKILEDINFNYYGGLQYQFNKFLKFKSGVHRYIPKSKEFTLNFESEDITLDFTEPVNMSTLTYPSAVSYLMASDAWDENADSMPDRQVEYAYDETNDNIAVSFSSGFLPIYDAEPSVRKTKTSAATYVYTSKKTYPYFVDSLAFSETGTTNQIIKGVAYKKYNSADQKDISYYTIPYEGKTYVYVDCHEIAERDIKLSNVLRPGANFTEIEKSDNVAYTVENDVLNVEMTEGTYGYLALCVDNPDFEAEVISVNGSTGLVNLSFKNNSSESKTNTLLVATYSGGRLKEIKPETITLDAGVQYFFTKSFTANSFDKVKAFVWENISGMSPISANALGEVIPDYTTKYLGDGFTRITLKDAVFNAEKEKVFKVDIKEDGDYAVFLNQVAAAANGYSVTFEKGEEVINAFAMPNAASSTYKTNYIRVGDELSKTSGSVSLSKGVWTMKITSLLDVNISYIDIRSTVISVGEEALAIYPSDYNCYGKVGGSGTYISVEMNNGANSYPRAEGYEYFADYTNSELLQTNSSGRGIILSGNLQDHTYKVNVEQAGTYKIKVKVKALALGSKVSQTTDTTLSMDVNGGKAATCTHRFNAGDPAYSQSPMMECELVSALDKGVNNINLKLNSFRAYLYELVIEPYEA